MQVLIHIIQYNIYTVFLGMEDNLHCTWEVSHTALQLIAVLGYQIGYINEHVFSKILSARNFVAHYLNYCQQ